MTGDRTRTVVMVTGAYPPDVCGVGDYTGRLMTAAPAHWRSFVERDWSIGRVPGIVRRLLALRPEIVALQYPTQGYGWSLVPHLLVLFGAVTRRYRPVLVLHEYSSLSRKSQIALALTSHMAAHIVFTTEAERDRASADMVFASRAPTSVIGILSNIPDSAQPVRFDRRSTDIAYFGHIRPNKGLEDFLDVAAGVRRADGGVSIAVIGEVPAGYEAFGAMVAERCRVIGCTLTIGADDREAGRRLADTRIVYLPFPDGVSARRGTALAGLGNGAILATRVGAATPDAMRTALLPCEGGAGDVDILLRAMRMSEEAAAGFQRAGRAYLSGTLPRDWSDIVARYDEVFRHAGVPG